MRFLGGVLLFILILSSASFGLEADQVVLDSYVKDYADVISAETEQGLAGLSKSLMDAGIAEYAIVVVDSLEGKAIEAYALEVAQGKLGNSETNNGLLLLISIEDRAYRFEVGRGLEGELNDAKVGRIGRTYFVDNFRAGDYETGIILASQAVYGILTGSEYQGQAYIENSGNDGSRLFSKIMYFVIILLWVILPMFNRKKGGKNNSHDYFGAALIASSLLGGGRGGSGGGFGGFGGGGFGGGGAGGGW